MIFLLMAIIKKLMGWDVQSQKLMAMKILISQLQLFKIHKHIFHGHY